MRKTTRRITWLLLIGALIYFGRGTWWPFVKDVFHLSTAPYEETDQGLVYRLETGRPLVFSFPPTQMLKLITNAVVPSRFRPGPGESFPYVIRYDLLDASGKVLVRKKYYQSATLTQYRDARGRGPKVTAFLENRGETPMDGKIILLNFKGIKGTPRRLRVHVEPVEKPLTGALIRFYWKREFPAHKLKTKWKRLSLDTKNHLAKGNIYPVQLLNETEKRNLAAFKWEVMAPAGVPGDDFERLTLFKLKQMVGTLIYPYDKWSLISPGVLYVRPGLRGTVPLPEKGGLFRFRFSALSPNAPLPRNLPPLLLTWYGPRAGESFSFTLPLTSPTAILERELKGGLLEIETPMEMTVNVEQVMEKELLEITPLSMFLQTFRCDNEKPLEYRVFHPGDAPVPFRFDLRLVLPPGPGGSFSGVTLKDASVQCQFLDTDGNITKETTLRVPAVSTLYDREPKDRFLFSEKVSYYFMLSPGTASVRFTRGTAPVVVAAYNRPPGMQARWEIPENRFAFYRDQSNRRNWFFVEPHDSERLVLEEQMAPLLLQYRPPETDEDIFAGRYLGESLVPEGRVPGRMMLIQRERFLPLRERARASMYRSMEPGKEYSFNFIPLPGRSAAAASVKPRMVYLNRGNKSVNARVFINKKPFWSGRLSGSAGEIILEPFSPGRHSVRVEAPGGTRFFIDKTDASGLPLYMRRLGFITGERPLVFNYTKQYPRESINIKIFSPYRPGVRAEIAVKVSPERTSKNIRAVDAPLAAYTLYDRVYSIKPDMATPVPVLHTRNGPVDGGRDIFLELQEDLPAGEYRVSVRLVNRRDGYYASVFRVVPGEFEEESTAIQEMEEIRNSKHEIRNKFEIRNENVRKQMEKWKQPGKGGEYKQLSNKDLQRYGLLFRRIFKMESFSRGVLDGIRKECGALGLDMEVRVLDAGKKNTRVLILKERGDAKHGRGFYLFRAGGSSPILLQAPHRYSDRLTGKIVQHLFMETNVRAAAFNSLHRKEADLAHLDGTVFQECNNAFGRVFPKGRIVQVHGFARGKRSTGAGHAADMIISNGTKTPSNELIKQTASLSDLLKNKVKLYPRDIIELGGTTNTQGRALRRMAHPGFVHIEIALKWRKKLAEFCKFRRQLSKALEL